MTQLAIADDPRFELSYADVGGDGPSFTVDLLERLKREHGPGTELAFISGMDIPTSCTAGASRCASWSWPA